MPKKIKRQPTEILKQRLKDNPQHKDAEWFRYVERILDQRES